MARRAARGRWGRRAARPGRAAGFRGAPGARVVVGSEVSAAEGHLPAHRGGGLLWGFLFGRHQADVCGQIGAAWCGCAAETPGPAARAAPVRVRCVLVEHGLQRLREGKVESCHLEVRMDNEGAIAFYQALGFERTGRRRSYYRDGTDAAIYSLAL